MMQPLPIRPLFKQLIDDPRKVINLPRNWATITDRKNDAITFQHPTINEPIHLRVKIISEQEREDVIKTNKMFGGDANCAYSIKSGDVQRLLKYIQWLFDKLFLVPLEPLQQDDLISFNFTTTEEFEDVRGFFFSLKTEDANYMQFDMSPKFVTANVKELLYPEVSNIFVELDPIGL